MSSTNRGYNRHVSDYYVTPVRNIIDFLEAWQMDDGLPLSSMSILDPCAGGDKDNEMSYPQAFKTITNAGVLSSDIREDSRANVRADYLEANFKDIFDIIITNPPFYLAEEIITKALDDVKEGGYVIMLLRLNFFGSKARKSFFEKHMPLWAYIHHRRMSFTKDKGTDSIEYAHFIWKKGLNPPYTKVKII